jgi:hypothetical protein
MAKAALAPRLLLALGVAAAPLAAYAAAAPAEKSSDYYTKRTCQTIRPTGSRLGGVRRCRTQAEIDQARRESREILDRVQAFKPTICPPPPQDC